MSDLVMDAYISELQDQIRSATAPLAISGGHTRRIERFRGEGLSTKTLSGICHYDPGALVITAYAGTPLKVLERELDNAGQYFAFEPRDHRVLTGQGGEPTLGGAIAANAYGERRFRFGAARDAVLGARFLNGAGEHIRAGGEVIKNVTGYDLSRVHVGANGAFGVLTQISLRLWPKPEMTRSFMLEGEVDQVWPIALQIARAPIEATAIIYLDGQLFIRMEGGKDELARRVSQLQTFAAFEEIEFSWETIRDLKPFAAHAIAFTVFTTPDKAHHIYTSLAPKGRAMISQAGNEVIFAPNAETVFETDCLPMLRQYETFARPVLPIAGRFPARSDAQRRYIQGLKSAFDPRGIFTPIEGLL